MKGLHFKEWKVSENGRLLIEAIKSQMMVNVNASVYAGEYGLGFDANICNIIGIEVSSAWRTDHSGIRASITLFGWEFSIEWYDVRHWDDENETWENDEVEVAEEKEE